MANATQRSTVVDPGRYGLPIATLTNPRLVEDALEHAANAAVNLLSPLTTIQYIPPDHQIAMRCVFFDPGGEWKYRTNGTWYELDGGNIALHKPGLRMLASMAGLSYTTERIDNQMVPFRWAYRAVGRMKSTDGQFRQISAEKELDLSDDGAETREMERAARGARDGARDPGKQLSKARQSGNRLAEAKAVNALIRDVLGLKGGYTKQEAARPFVFPVLIWTPDLSDPETRRMMVAAELGVVRDVYGPGSAQQYRAEPRTIAAAPPARQIAPTLPPRGATPPPHGGPATRTTVERGDDPPDPIDIESGDDAFVCSECGEDITEKVANYSDAHFGRLLCMTHQKTAARTPT